MDVNEGDHVRCRLYGEVHEATVVRVGRQSIKVSLLGYHDIDYDDVLEVIERTKNS